MTCLAPPTGCNDSLGKCLLLVSPLVNANLWPVSFRLSLSWIHVDAVWSIGLRTAFLIHFHHLSVHIQNQIVISNNSHFVYFTFNSVSQKYVLEDVSRHSSVNVWVITASLSVHNTELSVCVITWKGRRWSKWTAVCVHDNEGTCHPV